MRLAVPGFAQAVACDGCPSVPELLDRYEKAGGRFYVCPVCVNARKIDGSSFASHAELAGTVPVWTWIGDEAATTFSY